MVTNPRKDFDLYSLWLNKYESVLLKNLLKKKQRTEQDIIQIGDIVATAFARKDFEKR